MTTSESDDEGLARAIALSLEARSPQPSAPHIVDLTGDDDTDSDEEDVAIVSAAAAVYVEPKAPAEPSRYAGGQPLMAQDSSQSNPATDVDLKAVDSSTSLNNQPSTSFCLSAMNRKQMEEERLARAKKRKQSISPPPRRKPVFREAAGSEVQQQSNGDSSSSRPASVAPKDPLSEPSSASLRNQPSANAHAIQYPKGVVKKTWALGYPRDNDVKFEEVLQRNTLELAVLSAFQWDDEWVLSKLNLRQTKLVCVVQAHTNEEKAVMRTNAPPQIRFCFPSMEGQINCMHSKLQLLSHPTHLRIVVPSANLVPYDWGESGGIMENIVFMIDLPRLPDGQETSVDDLTHFGKDLTYFLEHLGLERRIIDSLRKFDFSSTAHLGFVHSIGGAHGGDTWRKTGYCGLGTVIRNLGLDTAHPLSIDITSASIGFLNHDFLTSIYLAAQGDDGLTAYNWKYSRPGKKNAKAESDGDAARVRDQINDSVKIYYPSDETVRQSKGGPQAAGTICFQSRWWEAPQFPRSLMRDCLSSRAGLLMHNKMIFTRPHTVMGGSDGKKPTPWAYVGSANLSESAWGKLVKDRSSSQPKLNCRNWECGVIVPILDAESSDTRFKANAKAEMSDSAAPVEMDVFQNVVPVPMRLPADSYTGGKQPWFYSSHSRFS